MYKKMLAKWFTLLILLSSSNANSVEPIRVLILRTSNITASTALQMLTELNALMHNAGLPSYDFVNAGAHLGSPNLTKLSSCYNTDHEVAIGCLANNHAVDRVTYDADIVLFIVPQIFGGACGATTGMVNLPGITSSNRPHGHALVAVNCAFVAPKASHEVLHLLSIEHKNGDPTNKLNVPVRDNHAYTYGNRATATAKRDDCAGNCNNWYNSMSNPDENFPGTSAAMGNSTHSNAKRVVQNQS